MSSQHDDRVQWIVAIGTALIVAMLSFWLGVIFELKR